MDVQLPDGTTVQGVPDGTSKAELAQKLKANGRDVPDEWLKPAKQPGVAERAYDAFKNVQAGITEPALSMATGMLAKPVSDVAGLGMLAAAPFAKVDPSGFKDYVQRQLTFEPKSSAGKAVNEYNPLALLGKLTDFTGGQAERGINAIPLPPGARPYQEAAGRGIHEAINQAPGLLGAKAGAKIQEGIPAKQRALDVQRGLNAPLDAIRERSQAAQLTTPPEGSTWIAGIPGMAKVGRVISAANQPEFNRLIAEQFGFPEGKALTADALEQVIREKGAAKQALVESGYGPYGMDHVINAPETRNVRQVDKQGRPIDFYKREDTFGYPFEKPALLPVTGEFKKALQKPLSQIEAQLLESPETFKSLKPSASILREWIKKDEIDPKQAMKSIDSLRSDAQTNLKSVKPKDRQAGFTRLEIANRLEDMFEDNLKGDPAKLNAFREARKTQAQAYDVLKVIDKAGNVDAQKLAVLSRRRPLSENLKLVSDYAETFPKGAKKVTEGIQAVSPFDWMFGLGALASGHPGIAASEIGARVAIPSLIARGMLQNRTPSYQVGAGRTAAPYLLPAAGAAISQQRDQLESPP
jgi:hypothetical protein